MTVSVKLFQEADVRKKHAKKEKKVQAEEEMGRRKAEKEES